MSNTYNSRTNIWTVDTAGQILNIRPVAVEKVIYFPTAVDQVLILTDKYNGRAIKLKAGALDASPVHLSFASTSGRKLPNLKVGQIDGGEADIYLIKKGY